MRQSAADVTVEGRVVKAVLHAEYSTFPAPLRQLVDLAPLGFEHPSNGQIVAAYRSARSNGGNIAAYLDSDWLALYEIYRTSKDIETPDDVLREVRVMVAEAIKRKLKSAIGSIESAPSQAFEILKALAPVGKEAADTQERWSIGDLQDYAPDQDPNAVIGLYDGKTTRYLCKGAGVWLIGQSGIGKSSLAIQQAFTWALGRDFFGIKPAKLNLRVMVVQSENDQGDCAEAVQGVCSHLCAFEEDMLQLQERARIVRCRGFVGSDFCHWLEDETEEWNADIVYVDPLLRYAGIDVSRQDQCTRFLNEQLDPMLKHTGIVLIGCHHTGKPKSPKETRGWTTYDHAYSGIGSSELVNWARAIQILRVVDEEQMIFDLLLAKRGNRAFATHPQNDSETSDAPQFTTKLYLKHSSTGMFWEQVAPADAVPHGTDESKSAAGRPSIVTEIASMNLHEFLSRCISEGEGQREIAHRLENWLASQHKDISLATCRRVVARLVETEKLSKLPTGKYVKGPNA